MREIIGLSIGQFGCNVGFEFWKKIAQEHRIDSNGMSNDDFGKSSVMFEEVRSKKKIPRCVFFDSDPEPIDRILGNSQSSFMNPDSFRTGNVGYSNNWAKGYYSEGQQKLDIVLDLLRSTVEKADQVQAFQMIYSLGGGTGSGFGSKLMEKVHDSYPNVILQTFNLYPTIQDNVVNPYNTLLSVDKLLTQSDAAYYMDNDALYRVADEFEFFDEIKFEELNQKVAQLLSCTSSGVRFPGQQNVSIRKQMSNLSVYPRMHFFAPSLISQESKMDLSKGISSVHQLNHYFALMPRESMILAANVQARGEQISTYSLAEALLNQKQQNLSKNLYAEWIPDTYTFGVSHFSPIENEIEICMDEMEIVEARSQCEDIIADYKQYQIQESSVVVKKGIEKVQKAEQVESS